MVVDLVRLGGLNGCHGKTVLVVMYFAVVRMLLDLMNE